MEAGALKMDASVDLKPTGAKQVIIETAAKVVTPSSSSAKSMAHPFQRRATFVAIRPESWCHPGISPP